MLVAKDIQPKPPVEVEVAGTNWRLALSYKYAYGTSEDWNHYSVNVLDTR